MITKDKQMIGAHVVDPLGSSVHQGDVGNGMDFELTNCNGILGDNVLHRSNYVSKYVFHGCDTYDAGTSLTSKLVDSLDQPKNGARERWRIKRRKLQLVFNVRWGLPHLQRPMVSPLLLF
jgi:hypothetical protein